MAKIPPKTIPREPSTVPLSEAVVVECALQLAKDQGLKALTVRSIGQTLGVDPTAFYRHFKDKDDLLLACMDAVIKRAFTSFSSDTKGLDPKKDWRQLLQLSAHAILDSFREYPSITSACFSRVTGRSAELVWIEFFVSTLSAIGLKPEKAAYFYRALVDAVLSLAALRVSVESLPEAAAAKNRSAWFTVYGAVEPTQYPSIHLHAQALQQVQPETVFDIVVDAILDKIESAREIEGT